jgi:hypothetical protein
MDVGSIGVAAVWINDDGAMTELDIAFEVAQRLLNWTPSTVDHAFIEDVEVVVVDGLAGLDIRWTQVTSDQGLRRFGLLTTVSELLDDRIESEGLDWATQALILAVQEPHPAPRRDVRTVFRQIP